MTDHTTNTITLVQQANTVTTNQSIGPICTFTKLHYVTKVRGGDQCLLGDSITEVKQRRARLVPGWVTAREG